MRRVVIAGSVLVVGLTLAPRATAADFVQEGAAYPVGAAPYGVLAADFNGDGRPDVATTNGTASNVSVLLRQTGGGFTEEVGSPFAAGAGASFATAADFNGDSLPDLATANFVAGNVSILLRQASGGFVEEAGSPVGLPDPPRPSAIAAGDFNGDTRIDLAVARWDASMVTILLRRSEGGFTTGPSVAVGANPRHMAVADFNGDSLPDLAVADQGSDQLTVLLGNSTGGFTAEAPVPAGDQPSILVARDFDVDGRTDLAVTNFASNSVSIVLRSPSNDGFVTDAGSPVTVGLGPVGLATADFDGDGSSDLAVANNAADSLTILTRGVGGFTPDREEAMAVGNSPWGLTAADFDVDGKPDLAVGHDQSSELWVLLNATPPPPPPSPPPPPTDTDGDGVPDADDLCPTVPANTPDGCPVVEPPEEEPPPPPPALGKTVTAELVKGEVLVKLPADPASVSGGGIKGTGFVPLTEVRSIPVRSILDTTRGTVELSSARNRAGSLQSGQFSAGIFQVLQSRKKKAKGLTELRLKGSAAEFKRCPEGKLRARAAGKRRRVRRLRGNAKGRYRTRGRHSAATVRGTIWTVTDRCDGTLTTVKRGKVAVRDFRLKKTVVLKRGKRYLARAVTR